MSAKKSSLLARSEWLLPRRRTSDPTDLAQQQAQRQSAVYRHMLLALAVLLAPINVQHFVERLFISAAAGLALLLLLLISIYQLSRLRKPLLPPVAAWGSSLALLMLSVHYGRAYEPYWLYPLLVALPILLRVRIGVWLGLATGLAVSPLVFRQFETGIATIIILSMAHTWLICGGMMYAISENNRRPQVLVNLDSLTGLQERRYLPAELARHWQRWSQETVSSTLMMLNLDHLKTISDGHGQAAVDRALQAVASVLQQRLRKTDASFRYGGEQFFVILSSTGITEAILVAEDIRRKVESIDRGDQGTVTVSIGLCECGQAESREGWQHLAERALQQAQGGGHNRVAVAGEADGAKPIASPS